MAIEVALRPKSLERVGSLVSKLFNSEPKSLDTKLFTPLFRPCFIRVKPNTDRLRKLK